MAFPNRNVFVGLPKKQNLSPSWVGAIGRKQQDGFFLIDARKVKEVVVLSKLDRTVCIGWQNIVGIENRDGIFGHFRGKFGPISLV